MSNAHSHKPRIGLLLGDPCGIGPEVLLKMLTDSTNQDKAHIIIIGDQKVWERATVEVGVNLPIEAVGELSSDWHSDTEGILFLQSNQIEPSAYQQGRPLAEAGQYVLDSSRIALELVQAGQLDGVCFAPFNKQAMHLAGSPFEDDLRYFAHVLEVDEYVGELNVIGDLWSARVTSHVSLKEVADLITEDSIEAAVSLVDRSLRRAGLAEPRIGVAALNPHAGEGGLFGREEIETIQPVVNRLSASMNVTGPYPSDTIFLKAQ
ncbi:4-hydroxythreonine-4-phosphate dehydrogenase PdxA [Chloroflexi bacterium TSY]|nr:4-hydroxythreonine-4-phosphate dehydrogenase PdxA [Chloroflexi bacterium TSY]